MGKNKKKNNNNNNSAEPQDHHYQHKEETDAAAGAGANNTATIVVLKADLNCDGCARKLLKCINDFPGVHTVTVGDHQMITVTGKVDDPAKLREKVERKTHQKVDLISPKPKNDADKKKTDDKSENEKKSKEKEPPVTTTSLKIHLHCEGCVKKIYKIVTKTKGFHEMKIDEKKNLVTVTGSIDVKALAESLQKRLKRDVEIVKKDGDKKDGKGKPDSAGAEEKNDGKKQQQQQQQQQQIFGYPHPYPYQYPFPHQTQNPNPNSYVYPVMYGAGAVDPVQYNPYAGGSYNFPQPHMFSDENQNSCSVM